jgi:hypothetical protein
MLDFIRNERAIGHGIRWHHGALRPKSLNLGAWLYTNGDALPFFGGIPLLSLDMVIAETLVMDVH